MNLKWIACLPFSIVLTACGYTNSTEVVEYREVIPVVKTRIITKPVVTRSCCPNVVTRVSQRCCSTTMVTRPRCCGSTFIANPVIYDPISIADPEPVDVTSTTIEYY